MFFDEFTPGNNLRPDKGRSTLGIYYTVVDWHAQVLQKASGWLTFGVLRSSVLAKVPGGLSALAKKVMHMFYSAVGPNLADGLNLVNPVGESFLVQLHFGGFLGDEKSLKDLWGTKGASGSKPCPLCKNVMGIGHGDSSQFDAEHYLVSIKELDKSKFDQFDDDEFYAAVDTLARSSSEVGAQSLALLQKTLGINHVPEGLLMDLHLRKYIKPVTHTLWDWMHCYLVHGTASIEIQCLVKDLSCSNANVNHVCNKP